MTFTNSRPQIAFIGLGAMGLPMASHLVDAGFQVTGFDLSEDARAAFTQAGGNVTGQIASTVRNADVVVTMLPNGKIVRQAVFAEESWRNLKKGSLVIDMSSSAPSETRQLAIELAEKEVRLVDAPVSGGKKKAVSGTLSIMVGGQPDDVEDARPILMAMGEKIFQTGPVGSGHAMKAINNYVSGAGVVATMEGVLLGEQFGLVPETVVDILNASTGRSNTSEVKMKQFVLSKEFNSGFALGLMAKDIRTASDLADDMGIKLDALSKTADFWDAAAKHLGPNADHTEIMRFISSRAHQGGIG